MKKPVKFRNSYNFRLLAQPETKTQQLRPLLILLFALGMSFPFYGQQNGKANDTTEVYKKIEKYSKKRKFTSTIHKWVFRPSTETPKNKSKKYLPTPDYSPYEGKIIRNIIVDTKDPFGFSFTDSTRTPKNWFERTGNTIHVKSKEMAIRNFLLIKENDEVDPLMITESARLLRAQNYNREVSIVPRELAHTNDSIDLVVTALDSWSLIPSGSLSTSETKVTLEDRNFLGTGHRFSTGYGSRRTDNNKGYEFIYTVPNFKNTFISASAGYIIDLDQYDQKFVSIDRIFYSPLTRWAGGVFIEERSLERPFPTDTLGFVDQDLKYIAQDYWAGLSWPLFRGSSERERTTNLVSSVRLLSVDYRQTPSPEYDEFSYFSGENFLLGTIGITSRQYIDDRYIFQDGITEDVPVGLLYAATGGVQRKNKLSRLYLGTRASYGNYFKYGFISLNFEMGSFFNHSKTEQTAFTFQANYFSELIDLNDRWKMRQFVKPQIVIGINRLDSPIDRLSLNDRPYFNGVDGKIYDNQSTGSIHGFKSLAHGTRKYVLESQTQFYSPWAWFGFRFNPFANLTLGMITDKDKSYGSNRLYSSIGLGCIVRNDYLVFDTFQLSFTFYPSMPGQGNAVFKPNAFETDDFGFQSFQILKPRPVFYR